MTTINEDGFPYVVAMQFVYHNEKIYMHGLPKGQKIDNINRCSKICFEVDELPLGMIKGTAVIGIEILECTGKYYK